LLEIDFELTGAAVEGVQLETRKGVLPMTTSRALAGLLMGLVFIASRWTAAQECPIAEIGQTCDARFQGTCITAACTETSDGSTTSRPCAACVTLGGAPLAAEIEWRFGLSNYAALDSVATRL
jgi:hypothetical protein